MLTDITNVTNCHLRSDQQRVLLRLNQYATSECQICLIFQEVCPAAYLMISRSAILIFWLKILWALLPVFPQSVPGNAGIFLGIGDDWTRVSLIGQYAVKARSLLMSLHVLNKIKFP